MSSIFSHSYALEQDAQDELKAYREQFYFPQHDGKDMIYLCGNSLGLQPKSVIKHLERELEQWKTYGVEGHFMGAMPWKDYYSFFKEKLAKVAGALPHEVSPMNTLTANLHFAMISFYRPSGNRYKIMMEGGAFSSDMYAVETQARLHGYDPDDVIIELYPREGEHTLRDEDILEAIREAGDSLALAMFGGVNYYTGQYFDLPAITKAAHAVGAYAGFDLAHAIGNLPVKLHDWDIDFAVWCSYKYMNSGPGGPGGMFIHEKHFNQEPPILRLAGWWGYEASTRFKMMKGYIPDHGIDGWNVSNAQVIASAPHLASLDIFDAVGMEKLRAKSLKLTGYLEQLLQDLNERKSLFEIITPKETHRRGCQLSLLTGPEGRKLFDYLSENGVIADWRNPNVIRIAPAPLYNSFEDVWQFYKLLDDYQG